MQITDTIADMLTRIRNANSAKHDTVDVPASNMKKAIAQILVDEGYIKSFQVIDDGKQGTIRIQLKYGPNKTQVLMGLRRVSKPGLRIYSGVEDMPGWTSLMVVMLFSFGVIMVMLGLLGEYIWRALDASRNRPPFLIDETKGFDEKKEQ